MQPTYLQLVSNTRGENVNSGKRWKAHDEELISFGVEYLEHTKDRGDYKELMSLSLLLLGAYPSDLPPYHVR